MATILLAEDDSHTIRIVSLWLGKHGHRTIETRDGAAALRRLREDVEKGKNSEGHEADTERIDMLISDVNMPELDGIGLVEAVREELHLEIPIIVLSSRCDQIELNDRFKTYRVEVLPKPFVPSRLVSDIERLLAGASALQADKSV